MSKKIVRLPDGREIRCSNSLLPASLEPSLLRKFLVRFTMFVVFLYCMFPIYWLVISATKSTRAITNTNGLWFAPDRLEKGGETLNTDGFHMWENLQGLMNYTSDKGGYWNWVLNSLHYSMASAIIGTIISVMAGYALSKFKFRGSGVIQAGIMAGLLMPVALLSIPMYFMFVSVGLDNTPLAVIIPCAVSPFGVFLARVYVDASVPNELMEAARIDGAGEFRIFFGMVIRLLAPAMVTIFLFIFVATWNNFLLPLVMFTEDGLKPVTVGLFGMTTHRTVDKGQVLIGSLMGVLPMIVLFTFLQRYLRAGLAAGAVKG